MKVLACPNSKPNQKRVQETGFLRALLIIKRGSGQKATGVGPSFLVLDHQLEPLQKLKLTSYDAPPEAWTASVDTEGSC